ncbi:ferredoxin [Thermococci archaeon]|nr:MAG: ferredoxin [Thermococci archaeon]
MDMLYTPLSTPSKGSIGKTGGWRTYKPMVQEDKCVGCNLCVTICPDNTIKLNERKKAFVDYEYCKGCGLCAQVCPTNAIRMEREVL